MATTFIADRVLAILKKGTRTSYMSGSIRKLGLSMRQYQRAIDVLRNRGLLIDSDLTAKTIETKSGKRRAWIATHQLVTR